MATTDSSSHTSHQHHERGDSSGDRAALVSSDFTFSVVSATVSFCLAVGGGGIEGDNPTCVHCSQGRWGSGGHQGIEVSRLAGEIDGVSPGVNAVDSGSGTSTSS